MTGVFYSSLCCGCNQCFPFHFLFVQKSFAHANNLHVQNVACAGKTCTCNIAPAKGFERTMTTACTCKYYFARANSCVCFQGTRPCTCKIQAVFVPPESQKFQAGVYVCMYVPIEKSLCFLTPVNFWVKSESTCHLLGMNGCILI